MHSALFAKGIVESGVKYVKGNFLPTRTFRDLADLNAQARSWVMTEAGVRVHGTTREQPLVLFVRISEERDRSFRQRDRRIRERDR